MVTASENNKRIAKNTLMLYIRMFLIMGISLFSSREILRILGVEDFGIYNIISGIIVLFSFLNNSMLTTTQRFLNIELGQNNKRRAHDVFSMSVNIHIGIALLIFMGGETVGLWILNTYINIPSSREFAAHCIYHFSILTAMISVIRAPYTACIIAYEQMSVFAYISIVEVILKLMIVYILLLGVSDRLIMYAFFLLIVATIVTCCYYIFCIRKYAISRFRLYWDRLMFKKLVNFSGWNLLGSIANLGAFQGVAIVQNVFCGVLVNAAMGIANQVNAAIYSFSSNFQLAFNPQITKSYAAGDDKYFVSLLYKTSRYSFFLLLIVSVPVLIYCDGILSIWLKDVPEFAVPFCQLMIYSSLIDAIAAPLWMGVQACGKIQRYQVIVSIILLLNIPLSYIVLLIGLSPESVLIVRIALNVILYGFRLLYLTYVCSFSICSYVKKVMLPCFYVSIAILIVVSLLSRFESDSIVNMFFHILVLLLSSLVIVYTLGFMVDEKSFFKRVVFSKMGIKC